jgi:DNA-binding response OmpR family regulator
MQSKHKKILVVDEEPDILESLIIMFSAHLSAEQMAREAGADEFIDKPFDIDDLLSTVARNL